MHLDLSICVLLTALFVFLDLCDSRRSRKLFQPKKNPCFPELLCNVTTSYPNRIIKKLIRENKKKWTQLSGSVIETSDQLMLPQIRFPGESIEEENLCRTQSRTVKPKVGFDVNMQLRYIVNFRGFEQVLKYETCIDANEECFGNGILPNDFKTFCKQAYSIIRLVSLNSTGHVEYGRFQIPSTCVCSYQRQNIYPVL